MKTTNELSVKDGKQANSFAGQRTSPTNGQWEYNHILNNRKKTFAKPANIKQTSQQYTF